MTLRIGVVKVAFSDAAETMARVPSVVPALVSRRWGHELVAVGATAWV